MGIYRLDACVRASKNHLIGSGKQLDIAFYNFKLQASKSHRLMKLC